MSLVIQKLSLSKDNKLNLIIKQIQTRGARKMSNTINKQEKLENIIRENKLQLLDDISRNFLLREEHVAFLEKSLVSLPVQFVSLNSSKPWLLYWILHSMELLNVEIQDESVKAAINYIEKCQVESGGFGGGPHQMAHLGNTYAAVDTKKTNFINHLGMCVMYFRKER